MNIEELVMHGEEFAKEVWEARNVALAEQDPDLLPTLTVLHDSIMLSIAHLHNGIVPEFPETLQERLRWAIEANGTDPDNYDTIYNLSKQAGLSMLTVENAVSGVSTPRSGTLRKLEEALGVEEGWLDV